MKMRMIFSMVMMMKMMLLIIKKMIIELQIIVLMSINFYDNDEWKIDIAMTLNFSNSCTYVWLLQAFLRLRAHVLLPPMNSDKSIFWLYNPQ